MTIPVLSILAIICIGVLIYLLKNPKKKEDGKSGDRNDSENTAAIRTSPEMKRFLYKDSQDEKRKDSKTSEEQKEQREGICLFSYPGVKDKWICKNCEAENVQTAMKCEVCHSDRQGE